MENKRMSDLDEFKERWRQGDVKFVPDLFEKLEQSREAEKELEEENALGAIVNDNLGKKITYLEAENAELSESIKNANIARCRLGKERNGFKEGVISLHREIEGIEDSGHKMRVDDAKAHREKIDFLKKENADLQATLKVFEEKSFEHGVENTELKKQIERLNDENNT